MIPKEDPGGDGTNIHKMVFSLNRMATQTKENSNADCDKLEKEEPNIICDKLKRYMIPVQRIVTDFRPQLPFVTICLLDCCRLYFCRNPYLKMIRTRKPNSEMTRARKPNSEMTRARDLFKNSSEIGNGSFLIGFACAPGALADDNEKAQNGLYTKHLLKHIVNPEMYISMILCVVRKAVIEESNGRQAPEFINGLATTKDIFLFEKVPVVQGTPSSPSMSLMFE